MGLRQRLLILLSILSVLTIACGAFFIGPQIFSRGDDAESGGSADRNLSNGEKIYFTATNLKGERIAYRGGPSFGGMMGSYLTCAACHGPEARGGVHFMHMQTMDAPDIRYVALSGEAGEHDETQAEGHDDEHADYDLEDFRSAVIDGEHPDGESLDRDMPRWRMSDEDLADLFAFLKSIP